MVESDDKIVLEFIPEVETKRTIRFREVLLEQQWSDEDVAIGPLYIKKQALKTGFDVDPTTVKRIRVTIEAVEVG